MTEPRGFRENLAGTDASLEEKVIGISAEMKTHFNVVLRFQRQKDPSATSFESNSTTTTTSQAPVSICRNYPRYAVIKRGSTSVPAVNEWGREDFFAGINLCGAGENGDGPLRGWV